MNVKLVVSYDGTAFHGFQSQPNVVTVEETLRRGVTAALMDEHIKLCYAGRTDNDVHAFGQVVNFHTDSVVALSNMARLINFHLPETVSVLSAEAVPEDFHARYSAVGKHYTYLIYNGFQRHPLYEKRAMHVSYNLDHERMERALQKICGEQDYVSFMGRYAVVKDTIRRVDAITVRRVGDLIILDFYGKSFLKNMVRILVGSAVEVGRGRCDENFLYDAMVKRDRKAAGPTAPGWGLYLTDIAYD
ncbi:tRNA pseudouridine(38-40) synthase TruA [Peptoniphilus equinus]|uniref:tRNA pseudouridine synthase A n=1 Tax=Peptoniphilus equinus TaxID=3016343 RepID=A0ABY7QX33_9FIRM|nr:tRNA pseudouridine(38-40) synthase TruA [Peptoniphilus equinus]WBW50488.1 tRNA pseudouridine(38-40) synthase TruA [Peptoniphilus equinus]